MCKKFCFVFFFEYGNTEQIVESVSSDKGEKSGKDARSTQQTTWKDNKAVSMEDASDSVHCPPLALIPISRILKGIPHGPHFLQLRSYSEMTRKILMNGWDRIFEETVEEIHSLSAKDFWARASQLCKTMEELNGLGYNVFPLRKRLVELAAVMEAQKLSKLEISRLKSKAESHRMEESRLESVILGLQQRARGQQAAMWELLKEVDKIEKDLPKFDDAFDVLAMESF